MDSERVSVETMPGITEYDTEDGVHVLRVHYSADPAKRSLEWKEREQKGTTAADWEQEFEINFNVPKGKPWYPEFRYDFHVAAGPLAPIPGRPVVRGWDYGLTPATVFCQGTAKGQTLVLWPEIQSWESGILAHGRIVQAESAANFPGFTFADYGDPAGNQRAQTDERTCVQLLREEFGACFASADLLLLTDVYAAGETPIPGISGETLMEEVARQTGQDAVYLPERADLERYLAQHVRAGDLVITMGAGNILEVGEALVEQLKNGTAGQGEAPIVVVMGGPSSEAEVSRRSGGAILAALREKGYPAVGMELDPPAFAEEIRKLRPAIVFNALHGKYGEDGILQGTLDMLGIPYTGSGVRAAALTMDKMMTKRIFRAEGIATPRFLCIHAGERDAHTAERVRAEFDLPLVVKAPEQGSSIGVYIVTREEDVQSAIDEAFSYGDTVLVEEFIQGRELTVAVWGTPSRGKAFPIIEITTTSGRYDYASKYTPGASRHLIPAELSAECTAGVQEMAVRAFNACGCAGVARVDVMLSDAGEPYAIEVNSVPGMTAISLVPDAARAVGIEFPEFCEEMLAMAGYHR